VFDGSVLAHGPPTGVARAFLTTLRVFAAGGERCVVLLPAGARAGDELPPQVAVVAGPVGLMRKQSTWPALLRRLDADLVHVPVAAVPPFLPCPSVITVHDLPWRARPRLPRGDAPQVRHRVALHVAARAARAIIVPTAATANDLARELPAHLAARVHVVPHGVTATAPAPMTDLTGDLVVLGDDRPRKNHARIAAAHARARTIDARVPALRCIGPPLAFVSEADKDAALRHASGLLQLSLHEGFGLPVLEAMVRGVPVLCSAHGALAEVAGGAALLADATDVAAMAQAIVRLSTDENLRRELRARGLQRAAHFSDTASAAGWRRVHAAVLASRVVVGMP
jgi:glycosyltransferase involved in cell wall biosynthesis